MPKDLTLFWMAVLVGLAIGLLAFGYIVESEACRSRGGHIVSKAVPGIGISGNGSVATTFSTVSFCVSADGRILD